MNRVITHARANHSVCLTNGGHPALNFINTERKNYRGQYIDLLTNYSTFLSWCRNTKLIDDEMWMELDVEQYCYTKEAAEIFGKIITARRCFEHLFNAIFDNRHIEAGIIALFNEIAEEVRAQLTFGQGDRGLQLYWRNSTEEMNLPLWMIISAGVQLAQSTDVHNIKQCAMCKSLFIDNSRRGNKIWCDAGTCGSIKKSETYFEKKYVKNYRTKRNRLINK